MKSLPVKSLEGGHLELGSREENRVDTAAAVADNGDNKRGRWRTMAAADDGGSADDGGGGRWRRR